MCPLRGVHRLEVVGQQVVTEVERRAPVDGRDDAERAAIGAFVESYQRISDEFVGEAAPEELVDGAIRGMFDTLDDPYSVFMGADEFAARFEDVTGEFGGMGLEGAVKLGTD